MEIPSVSKRNNNTINSSTKLTPVDGFRKTTEKTICFNFQCRRQKVKKNASKYKERDSVRTADGRRAFIKEDSTNWCYHLFWITESYMTQFLAIESTFCLEDLRNLLKSKKLTLEENNQVIKKR